MLCRLESTRFIKLATQRTFTVASPGKRYLLARYYFSSSCRTARGSSRRPEEQRSEQSHTGVHHAPSTRCIWSCKLNRGFSTSQVKQSNEFKGGIKETNRSLLPPNTKVSSRTSPEKLAAALAPLLRLLGAGTSSHAASSLGSRTTGTQQWTLDPETIDAIIRVLTIQDGSKVDMLVSHINEAADQMNHHPEIHIAPPDTSSSVQKWIVTIRCTTHQPAGLSMRDARLAKKIDEIVTQLKLDSV